MKKTFLLSSLFILLSCAEESSFQFDEIAIEKNEPAYIEVIYPRLDEDSEASLKINNGIESTLAAHIAFFEENTDSLTLNNAISQFENRFLSFKTDFEPDATPWEVHINSEVVLQSKYVITIAIDSYTFTGGAHGNSAITLLNFDPKTGRLFSQDDLIKTFGDLTILVKHHFNKELEAKGNVNRVDYFFGDDFRLPENIGFNDEGVIFLYNNYELSSFADGIIEFTIPYSEISKYLKISH